MMDAYRVVIMPRVASDLEKIHKFIAKDSEQNAADMIGRIVAAFESLAKVPHRTVVEKQNKKLRYPARSLPVPPYIIYFRVIDDEKVVRVTHVRHGARLPPARFD
jgi:plasmid stabilization system protein ParE